MHLGGKAGAEGQLADAPHVFQMTQAIARALLRIQHNGVDRADRLRDPLHVDLIVAISACSAQLGRSVRQLHAFALHCAEHERTVRALRQLLIAGGLLAEHIVGIAGALEQSVFAVILGGRGLAAVGHFNRDLAVICHLGHAVQHRGIRDLYRIGDAGDVGSVTVHMIRTAHQCAGAGLIFGCGGNGVHVDVVLHLGGVEVGIGDVHQDIVQIVHRLGQVRDLLLDGRLIQRLAAGQHLLGLRQFGLEAAPGLIVVDALASVLIGIDQCLKLRLILLGCKLVPGNILIRHIELNDRVGVAQRVDGDGPIAGLVSDRAARSEGIRQTQLNAHGLVHPVICGELRTIGRLRVGVSAVVAVVSPDDRLHPGAQLAIISVQVNADGLAKAADSVALTKIDFVTGGRFQRFALNAGGCADLRLTEVEAAVVVLDRLSQAVGILIHSRNQIISRQLIFSVAAHKPAPVGDGGILCLERLHIVGLDLNGNILNTGHFIVIHLDGRTVRLGDRTAIPADGGAVGQVNGLTVGRPMRHRIAGAIGSIDHRTALEAAAVQTVIGGGTGDHVKRALVTLPPAVLIAGRSRAAGGGHAFVGPVSCPVQRGVQISVLTGRLGIGVRSGCLDQRVDGGGQRGQLSIHLVLRGIGLAQHILRILQRSLERSPALGGVVGLSQSLRLVHLGLEPGLVHGSGRGRAQRFLYGSNDRVGSISCTADCVNSLRAIAGDDLLGNAGGLLGPAHRFFYIGRALGRDGIRRAVHSRDLALFIHSDADIEGIILPFVIIVLGILHIRFCLVGARLISLRLRRKSGSGDQTQSQRQRQQQ